MHSIRRAVAALTMAFVVFGLGASGPLAQESVTRVSVAQLKKLYDAGTVVVVDVRSVSVYRSSHVAGALSIPLDTIEQKAGDLKKTGKVIVTYCT